MSEPIVVGAVATSGAASSVIDVWSRRVPNGLTLTVAALGITLATSHRSGVTVAASLAGFGLGLALMLPGYLAGATGGGDVKLFAAIGTLLGPKTIVVAFAYTAIAGGALALLIAARRHRLRVTVKRTATFVCSGGSNVAEIEHGGADNRFPYAPAIALGALAAALGI